MKQNKTRAKRRFQTQKHIEKQKRIAKAAGNHLFPDGYYKKHSAMDCGRKQCCLCGNPRKNKKIKTEKTIQEEKSKLYFDEEKRHL